MPNPIIRFTNRAFGDCRTDKRLYFGSTLDFPWRLGTECFITIAPTPPPTTIYISTPPPTTPGPTTPAGTTPGPTTPGPTTAPPTGFYHFLITGQSLAVGADAIPPVSVTQPYSNKMFVSGVNTRTGSLSAITPLIETQVSDPDSPTTPDGETIASGVSNELSRTIGISNLASCNGVSAATYSTLKKGTSPYNLGISQIQTAIPLLSSIGNYNGVLAIGVLHGEADQAFAVPNYNTNLATWQSDYQTDIKAITHQVADIPFYIYQQNNADPFSASSLGTATGIQQWLAHLANPTKIILVGPNYPYLRSDGTHFSARSARGMAYTFSKVMKRVITGNTWSPLMPLSATLVSNIVDVTFHVPVQPLVLDQRKMFNPGNYGFSFFDSDGSTNVTAVAILNPTTVQITLNQPPVGTGKQIRYAWQATGGGWGPIGLSRGCLRDSDVDSNPYGYNSFNWCISSYLDLT